MKKKYQKPSVLTEDFALSEYINGGCGAYGDTFSTDQSCAANYNYDDLLATVVDLDINSGSINTDNGIVYFCKHGSQGINVFTS